MSERLICPDACACHHDCVVECWRVSNAGPLTGVFPDDRWPGPLPFGLVRMPGLDPFPVRPEQQTPVIARVEFAQHEGEEAEEDIMWGDPLYRLEPLSAEAGDR